MSRARTGGRLAAAVVGLWMVSPALGAQQAGGEELMAFAITSSAFGPRDTIPKPYTCEGDDISPPLAWTDPPVGTKSFALIADDPDAPVGTWVHWVVYNIPASSRGLFKNVPKLEQLGDGTTQGLTDFKRVGYGGPCPPPGPVHRYVFTLYALDTVLELPPKATRAQLERAMDGHVLAAVDYIGLYRR